MTGPFRAIEWRGDRLRIVDQNALPARERWVVARDPEAVAQAIRVMTVRGAPLLGVTAGFGMALAAVRSDARGPMGVLRDLSRAGRRLIAARPTAVNVPWAVARVIGAAAAAAAGSPTGVTGPRTRAPTSRDRADVVRRAVVDEALRLAREEEASCDAIGQAGAVLVPAGANVLTHCNTGALATYGDGSALGVIAEAHRQGRGVHVWVDETRPRQQGARLTAWELQRLGIPMTLVADAAAGSLMARGLVDLVMVGADRIAANGDVANKVGTYPLAILARAHGIPFYVAAPISTVDPSISTGAEIVIEERDPLEVTAPMGVPVAPAGTRAANPAFDVTPSRLVTGIVTDHGVARRPYEVSLRRAREAHAGRDGAAARRRGA